MSVSNIKAAVDELRENVKVGTFQLLLDSVVVTEGSSWQETVIAMKVKQGIILLLFHLLLTF